jgi:hypothetical protein
MKSVFRLVQQQPGLDIAVLFPFLASGPEWDQWTYFICHTLLLRRRFTGVIVNPLPLNR